MGELFELVFADVIENLGNPLVLAGNIIALFACATLVAVGFCKVKRHALIAEIVESIFFAGSDGILGGLVGVITNLVAIARNLICYFGRLNWPAKIGLCLATLGIGVAFNSLGVIGVLPLIGTCFYICWMDTADPLKFKVVFALTMPMWLVFDWTIHSYVGFICDALCLLGALVAIVRILRDRRKLATKSV